jgi:hypothetical protein
MFSGKIIIYWWHNHVRVKHMCDVEQPVGAINCKVLRRIFNISSTLSCSQHRSPTFYRHAYRLCFYGGFFSLKTITLHVSREGDTSRFVRRLINCGNVPHTYTFPVVEWRVADFTWNYDMRINKTWNILEVIKYYFSLHICVCAVESVRIYDNLCS